MTFDFDRPYRVAGYDGIAFRALAYVTEWTDEGWILNCDIGGCDHDDEGCYVWSEGEAVENTDRVLVVMVGDDTQHNVGVDEVTPLSADGYCHSCGQIGCGGTVPAFP